MGIILIFILIIVASYFKPIKVSDLMKPHSDGILPDKVNCHVFFSALSYKELDVTDKDSIQQMVTLLDNMKVRRLLSAPASWRPKTKNTYRLYFLNGNKEIQAINILNSRYIYINRNIYKITGKPDISKLYEIMT